LIQIKSHAQKVLKRAESGENVFRRLEENPVRTDSLVAKIHADLGIAFSKCDECSSMGRFVVGLLEKKKKLQVKKKEQQAPPAVPMEQQLLPPRLVEAKQHTPCETKLVHQKRPLPHDESQPPRKRSSRTDQFDYSYIVAASALCELSRPAAATPSNSSSSSSSVSSDSNEKFPPTCHSQWSDLA
jgi:hypothetical protein